MLNIAKLIVNENELETDNPNSSSGAANFLFIGELAEKFGLSPRTIRFYEKAGLLEPARHGKFRTYLEDDAKKLGFVLKLRGLGLSIANIKSLASNNLKGSTIAKTIWFDHVKDLEQKKAMIERQLEESVSILETLKDNVSDIAA